MKNLKNKTAGFTIIEVMIVLAIAGVIMLIVLLAIPALQRNSRNTQRKADVAAMAGGINDYLTNNSNAFPDRWQTNNGGQVSNSAGSDTPSGAKMGYYTSSTISFSTGTQSAMTSDALRVVTGAVCTTGGATTSTGAGVKAYAIQYMIEGANGLNAVCSGS